MQRFDIITEADARRLEPGSTVELAAGGHVTPLAKDTLKARRVTVVRAAHDPDLPADLAPAVTCGAWRRGDHTGVALKVLVNTACGLAVDDLGVDAPSPRSIPDSRRRSPRGGARGSAVASYDGSNWLCIAANKIAASARRCTMRRPRSNRASTMGPTS
jgi:hypothetical protein